MKGFRGNFWGVVLASGCGILLLGALLMGLAWMRPAGTGAAPEPIEAADEPNEPVEGMADLGPLGKYRVVTDRPLFSETRRPVLGVDDGAVDTGPAIEEVQVADAPEVSLTGVVITPEARLVSLTPKGGGEALVFREGAAMQGDYNGWVVDQVRPRAVRLQSAAGARLELELQVHDRAIKTPPKPAPKPARTRDEPAENADGQEPLSRAEEIRQRIAERREQLRQQAAAEQEEDSSQSSPYQAAIQGLLNPGSKDDDGDDSD